MTMRLAVARATVTAPEGSEDQQVWENATAETRGGKLRIRVGKTVVREVDATAVKPLPGRKWEVTTSEGVFSIVRAGGCGCGRG